MKFGQFVFACLFLFGCAALAAGEKESRKDHSKDFDYAELDKIPEKQRVRANPLANDPEAATAGKILFEEHCAECHGGDAEGTKRAPSLRAPEVQNAAPGAIFWILSNGIVRKRMPVWSKLPEPQRWQLVSFIKSLGKVPTGPATPTPAQTGRP